MIPFLLRWFITTIAVMVAAAVIPTISYQDSAFTLFAASLLLGIINALIRPVLLILSLPFIVVTMGLFIFVINALMLMFVSWIIPSFVVEGFWAAFFGSIIISLVSWLFSVFFRTSDGKIRVISYHPPEAERANTAPGMKQADARVVDRESKD